MARNVELGFRWPLARNVTLGFSCSLARTSPLGFNLAVARKPGLGFNCGTAKFICPYACSASIFSLNFSSVSLASRCRPSNATSTSV